MKYDIFSVDLDAAGKVLTKDRINNEPMYRYIDTFLDSEFEETKRYTKHRDKCRQELNEYVCREFHKPNTGTGKNEPLLLFNISNFIGFFNMVCNINMSDTREEAELMEEAYKDTLAYHSFGSSYSPAIKYIMNFATEYKKRYGKPKSQTNKEIIKAIKERIPDNSNVEITLLNIMPVDNLIILVGDEFPIISTFLSYLSNTTEQIWHNVPPCIEVFNTVYNNTFFDYVHKKQMRNKDIIPENVISLTKFDNDADKLTFLIDLFNNLKSDLENIFTEVCIPTVSKQAGKAAELNRKLVNRKESEAINVSKKIIKELTESNEKYKSSIDKLQKTIDNESIKRENLQKSSQSEIAELNKQIKDLERQLKESKDKYNKLNDYINLMEDDNDEEEDDSEVIVDTNKKYVFISGKGHENYLINKIILETFPNSEIKFDNFNIQAKYTDMVIALTAYTKHSLYYDIKEQCKNKDIPFIHCNKKNINGIKRSIAGQCNYVNQ